MKKLLVVLILPTALTGACFAQDKATVKKEQQARQKAIKEQAAPVALIKQEPVRPPVVKFSMDMLASGRIDSQYIGIPAAEVIDAVEKLTNMKKGEFESSADYNTRREAVLAGKLLDELSIKDTIAFVVPVAKGGKYNNGIRYEFNADTGDVNLYVLPMASNNINLNGFGAPEHAANRRVGEGLDMFQLSRKIESQSTYQGSNAYGATITIEKINQSDYGIAVYRLPFLSFKREIMYSNPTTVAQLKLENSRAALELPALKALIIMKLADPYIAYSLSFVEPKRDRPFDITTQDKFLTGNVMGIVFYSGLTGEIFARIPETFGKP